MTATVTITRDQLAYVLLNLGLATTGTGLTDEVFAALRVKTAADAAADAWHRVPATEDTRALFDLAEKAQLHPRHDLTQVRSRGRYGIVLDGDGADALFGVVYVSARTGKPQRAHLVQDRGDERTFTGTDEIRAVLSDWLARVNGWRRVA
jgi:hypothetical protein